MNPLKREMPPAGGILSSSHNLGDRYDQDGDLIRYARNLRGKFLEQGYIRKELHQNYGNKTGNYVILILLIVPEPLPCWKRAWIP